MTHREQEEILRRALHMAADSIEPAADGLERIRERLSTPRPLFLAWLMGVWTGLAQPVLLRMEPAAAGLAGRLSERPGAWARAAAGFLGTVFVGLGPAVDRVLAALRRVRPSVGMSRHEKLRSALAFGAAAVIGAAGGFALSAGLPQQMISAANSLIEQSPQHHPAGGGPGSAESNSAQPNPSASGSGSRHRPGPTPSATPGCSPKARAGASPTPTSPSSPTPTSPSSPTPTSPSSPTPTSPSSPSPPTGSTLNPPPAANGISDTDIVVRGGSNSGKPTSPAASKPTPTPTPTCPSPGAS